MTSGKKVSLVRNLVKEGILERELILEIKDIDYDLCRDISDLIILNDWCDISVLNHMLSSSECTSITLDTIAHCLRSGQLSLIELLKTNTDIIGYSMDLLRRYNETFYERILNWGFLETKMFLRKISFKNKNDLISLLALFQRGDYAIKEILVKVLAEILEDGAYNFLKWVLKNEKGGVRKIASVRLIIHFKDRGAEYLINELRKNLFDEDLLSALSYTPNYSKRYIDESFDLLLQACKSNFKYCRYLIRLSKLAGEKLIYRAIKEIYKLFLRWKDPILLNHLATVDLEKYLKNEEIEKILQLIKKVFKSVQKLDRHSKTAIVKIFSKKNKLKKDDINFLIHILPQIKKDYETAKVVVDILFKNLERKHFLALFKKGFLPNKQTIAKILTKMDEKEIEEIFEKVDLDSAYIFLETILQYKLWKQLPTKSLEKLFKKIDSTSISKLASYSATILDYNEIEELVSTINIPEFIAKIFIAKRDIATLEKFARKYKYAKNAKNWLKKIY